MSGIDLGVGILSNAIYDSIKYGKDFVEPGFTGLIVETTDELSIKNKGLDKSLLWDFFLSKEISELVKKYRKTAEIDDLFVNRQNVKYLTSFMTAIRLN